MRKDLYIVAKDFNKRGCYAYKPKSLVEGKRLPPILDRIRHEGVEVAIVCNPSSYPEYAPYQVVEDIKEFVNIVKDLN